MSAVSGASAESILEVTGRAALGLATEVDLAVDDAHDLAADTTDGLEVSSGLVWTGANAVKTITT